MKYIDTHAHYLHKKYGKDRDELIRSMFESNVSAIIECGTNSWSNKNSINLAHKYKDIYATIGFFPMDVMELEDDNTFEVLKKQLIDNKVVGLGEIGLDYYHKGVSKEKQKEFFVKQLELAKELDLPVCIHSREAEKDTLEILKNFGEYRGVIHCFAYGTHAAKKLLDLGYSFGVGGTSTYVQNVDLRDAIRNIPLDRIVLETDAPYLSPSQVRGQRNDSSNIKYVISELASLKKTTEDNIILTTNENVKRIYNIGG